MAIAADASATTLIVRQTDGRRSDMETVSFKTDLIIVAFGVITTLRQNFHTAVQLTGKVLIAITVDQALRRWWQATPFLAQ